MINKLSEQDFLELQSTLEGDLHWDKLNKVLYATDASVYRVIPTAVCIPKNQSDLTKIISFCNNHAVPLIPRAAGTSLAGQVVGEGIVVDISKDFVNILEFNQEEQWVRVQPGVVRDQLNQFLEPYGFFFSPITSTANRATLGGMLGNNSSGTSSIKYGTTRDHIISVDTILSDGSITTFGPLNEKQLEEKRLQNDLEGSIYKFFDSRLSNQKVRDQITKEFPKTSIHRRNTGYAVDILMDSMPFNVAKLLCGSEGTLAFTTELKVHVDKLPPKEVLVVAAHFDNLNDSLLATKEAMKFEPFACELMDKIILDCTLENKEQRKNRFFVDGDPQAILMVEFRSDSIDAIDEKANNFIAHLKSEKLGFSFPIVKQLI